MVRYLTTLAYTFGFALLLSIALSATDEPDKFIEAAPGQLVDDELLLGCDDSLTEFPGKGGQLQIEAPDDIIDWKQFPGCVNEICGTLRIKSNEDWQITARDTNQDTCGRPREWNGTTYGSQQLTDSMNVSSTCGTTLKEGGVIRKGNDTSKWVCKGEWCWRVQGWEDVNVTFSQYVGWADPPLPPESESSYHIVVTFTGSLAIPDPDDDDDD